MTIVCEFNSQLVQVFKNHVIGSSKNFLLHISLVVGICTIGSSKIFLLCTSLVVGINNLRVIVYENGVSGSFQKFLICISLTVGICKICFSQTFCYISLVFGISNLRVKKLYILDGWYIYLGRDQPSIMYIYPWLL